MEGLSDFSVRLFIFLSPTSRFSSETGLWRRLGKAALHLTHHQPHGGTGRSVTLTWRFDAQTLLDMLECYACFYENPWDLAEYLRLPTAWSDIVMTGSTQIYTPVKLSNPHSSS